ncbi:MAG: PRC-barrel domain-containing protein [Deltaproteobacteria bacterium]|nr:PRC-barrel domain-containing protein [Deltaproteobacteria bacterium]
MHRYEATRGRQVVTLEEGAMIGKFDDFQFDIRTWRIFGYRLKPLHVFGRAGGVAAEDLDKVGRDVVFIRAESQVVWSGAARNPEEGRAWASRYLGSKVLSRDGTALGTVGDLMFDDATHALCGLILSDGRLVLLDERVSTGPAAVVLEDDRCAVPLLDPQENEDPDHWWARMEEASRLGRSGPTQDA